MAEQAAIPCPICAEALRFTVTTNRNGKHAIGLHCPQDGRHFRGFINHKPFVEDALQRMAEVEEARQTQAGNADAEQPALQKTSEGPAPTKATRKARAVRMNVAMVLLAAAVVVTMLLIAGPRPPWRWW